MEEEKKKDTGKNNKSTAETFATISEDYNNVLDFLQAISVKSLRVIAAPLSLCAEKPSRVWFCRWLDKNSPHQTRLHQNTIRVSREY